MISDDLGPAVAAVTEAAGPFVGRQRQISLLHDLLAQVREGDGQVVAIVAEPGMGKSRLLMEFRRNLLQAGIPCFGGRCRSFGEALPYLPLREVVRQVAGFAPGASSNEIAQANSRALARAGLDPDEGAPYLNDLFGVSESTAAFEGLSSGAVSVRTFETLRALLLPPPGRPAVIS